MPRNYSILLAEPNPLLREKMAGVLARSKDFWCVVQVEGRGNLARAAALVQPDFVVADLFLLKDPELVEFIRQVSMESRIFALVDTRLDPYVSAMCELGVQGVIERCHVAEELNRAIMNGDSSESAT